jgi:hypothetical protein
MKSKYDEQGRPFNGQVIFVDFRTLTSRPHQALPPIQNNTHQKTGQDVMTQPTFQPSVTAPDFSPSPLTLPPAPVR